jgi:hypothetical protein
MRSKNSLMLLFSLSLLLPNWLRAEPLQGFGLHLSVSDLQLSNSTTNEDYAESNAYGGIADYQWAASNYFSLRLFGGEHIGSGSHPNKPDYNYFKTGLFGLEARIWTGSTWFLGIHAGQAYLTWIESMESYTKIAWANQSGYGVGFESSDGWTFAVYAQKTETMEFENLPDQEVEGTCLVAGYRWK